MARQSASVTRPGCNVTLAVTGTAASDRIPLSRSGGACRKGTCFFPARQEGGPAGCRTRSLARMLAQMLAQELAPELPQTLAPALAPALASALANHWPDAALRNSAMSVLVLSASTPDCFRSSA